MRYFKSALPVIGLLAFSSSVASACQTGTKLQVTAWNPTTGDLVCCVLFRKADVPDPPVPAKVQLYVWDYGSPGVDDKNVINSPGHPVSTLYTRSPANDDYIRESAQVAWSYVNRAINVKAEWHLVPGLYYVRAVAESQSTNDCNGTFELSRSDWYKLDIPGDKHDEHVAPAPPDVCVPHYPRSLPFRQTVTLAGVGAKLGGLDWSVELSPDGKKIIGKLDLPHGQVQDIVNTKDLDKAVIVATAEWLGPFSVLAGGAAARLQADLKEKDKGHGCRIVVTYFTENLIPFARLNPGEVTVETIE